MAKRMRLMLFMICLGCLLGTAWAQGEPALIPDTPEITLKKGGTMRLGYSLENASGVVEEIWKSLDTDIVTVKKGVLTAKNPGTAAVCCTVKLIDGTSLTGEYTVYVPVPAEKIQLDGQKLTLYLGRENEQLRYTVLPEEAEEKGVRWSTSDTRVVQVDENGVLKAIKPGKARITAVAKGNSSVKATVNVTVLRPVTSLTVENGGGSLAAGKARRMKVSIAPEDAGDRQVTWSTSDRSVALVKDGVLLAKGAGTATITCTAKDGGGAADSFEITVYTGVTSVRLTAADTTLYLGRAPLLLNATVLPANAENKTLFWSSSAEAIATVDQNGLVTPVAPGTVSITAVSAENAAEKATITLKIVRPVTSLKAEKQKETMEKGTTLRPTVSLFPEDATNKRILWSSSDSAVASVSQGVVSAKKPGTAVITATAADGGGAYTAILIQVTQAVKTITFPQTAFALSEGHKAYCLPKVGPEDATDTRLVWSSSDESIAAVDSTTGEITGICVGSCTVTAAAMDGSGVQSSKQITVEPSIPLGVLAFTTSGKNGGLCYFDLTLKNENSVRCIDAIAFTLEYSYGGMTFTRQFSCKTPNFKPGTEKKTGRLEAGYQLTFAGGYKIYLDSVTYADGSVDNFAAGTRIGSF